MNSGQQRARLYHRQHGEGKIDVDELKGFVERVERSITMEN